MAKQGWKLIFWVLVLAGSTSILRADSPSQPMTVHPGALGRWVNPFLGTGGIAWVCGHDFPGAALPFSMVRLSPDTGSSTHGKAINTSGYFYRSHRMLGFSHTRLCGTGATDGGNFLVVPHPGPVNGEKRQRSFASFSHDREVAFPGYYAVSFPKLGILAELTTTPRVGVHRYVFSKDIEPHILIHVTNTLGNGTSKEGAVRVLEGAPEIEGSTRTFGTFASRHGGTKVYFAARFNRAFSTFGTWSGKSFKLRRAAATGDDVGVDVSFEKSDSPQAVELKLAISYVSLENARANLEAEAADDDFDAVLAKAKQTWEKALSLIRVEGGTDRQKTIFYTALYHTLLMPTRFSDVGGEYPGFDGQIHQAKGFEYFTDMSLWDTFRTVHPLYMLIAPREQRDMVVSLVTMARQGGHLPRWPAADGYTNSMFGTPADIVIAGSYLKGIRDFDAEFAYRSMRDMALGPLETGSRVSGREGSEAYNRLHYCPAELMDGAVSKTLEFAYADSAIARLAAALNHSQDAAMFAGRAQYYKNLWNPETQYFQPRDSQGVFTTPFDPLLLTYFDFGGKRTNDYVEGSALQWRWAVPFDPQGLVSLFRGPEYFVSELETFFARSQPKVGALPNAYYWHGNQPDLHAAYLFNAANRPDLTQKWVRWILDHKYGDQANGLDGNDDGGTLSAWYVFSSLGMYPIAGTEKYELGSPLWKRAEIRLGTKTLEIVADHFAPDHIYVQKVWLNGVAIDRTWLKHDEIAQGGVLRFEMGAAPAAR